MQSNKVVTALLVLACTLIVWGCREATLVSSSMTPSIKRGEKVTVDYTAYAITAPKRWDVAAFEPPGHTNEIWLMRVIALPGESVAFSAGCVTVGGQLISLPAHVTNVAYLSLDQLEHSSPIASPYVVPPTSFFVLGDNSAKATTAPFGERSPAQILWGECETNDPT